MLDFTHATLVARNMLRDSSHFDWSTIMFLGLVIYIYTLEIEHRRWSVVFAGLAFWLMDWFNELINSAILHISKHSALWTVTGHTSYLILIGLSVEISMYFAIAGIIFVKLLPTDRNQKFLGIPNRVVFVGGFSIASVMVEILLHSLGVLHWGYWWWNVPFIPLIIIFGYGTFYAMAAWVFDMGNNYRKQLRVVGALVILDVVLAVCFGLAGWL